MGVFRISYSAAYKQADMFNHSLLRDASSETQLFRIVDRLRQQGLMSTEGYSPSEEHVKKYRGIVNHVLRKSILDAPTAARRRRVLHITL